MLRLAVITVMLSALLVGLHPAAAPAVERDWIGAPMSLAPTAPDAQLWIEVAIAEQFWDRRNVAPCPTVSVGVNEREESILGEAAPIGGCRIAMNRRGGMAAARWKWFAANRFMFSAAECQAVVHEVGHARGLEHTTSGLMAPKISLHNIPWVCWDFARSLVRLRTARSVLADVRADLREEGRVIWSGPDHDGELRE